MTDSTMNTNSGEGTLDVGGVDGLFEDLEDESLEETPSDGDGTDDGGESTEPSLSDAVEDRTASAVFGQLQERVSETDDVDDVLADESPADIIASADEPEPEREPIGDELVDESALEELLLTDRTKSEEFLWVETDADDSNTEGSAVDDVDDSSVDAIDSVDAEIRPESDSAVSSIETEPETTQRPASDRSEADLDAALGEVAEASTEPTDEIDVSGSAEETDDTLESKDETERPAETPDNTATPPTDTAASEPTTTDEPTVSSATDDDSSSGLLGWLRSTLGGLFSRGE